MKFNDVFDTDEVLAWYDGDPQDGTYYRSQEPSRKPFENDFNGVDDRDDRHEEIKKHAALYICAHKELLKKSDYRIAYNKLLDEYARDYAYHVLEKPITVVTDEERAFSDSNTIRFGAVGRGFDLRCLDRTVVCIKISIINDDFACLFLGFYIKNGDFVFRECV